LQLEIIAKPQRLRWRLITTRNTFSSGQKYRQRKLPAILDRDVGRSLSSRWSRCRARRLDRIIAVGVVPRRSAAEADTDERSLYSWRHSTATYKPEHHRSRSVFYRKSGGGIKRTRICLTLTSSAARFELVRQSVQIALHVTRNHLLTTLQE